MTSITTETAETYVQIRQRNIAANRNLLLSLQLSGPGLTSNLIPKTAVNTSGIPTENTTPTGQKTRKTRRKSSLSAPLSEESPVNGDGRRRSSRILNLTSNHNKIQEEEEESSEGEEEYEAGDGGSSDDSDDQENQVLGQGKKRKSSWRPPQDPKRARGRDPPKRKAKSLKGARPNPKIFGHQAGTEVGDWWDSRMMCSQAGVHAPPVCGIYGTDEAGCYSVALSGGYEDDVDLGYAFTFTGAGGRALRGTPNNPKNLRTAPQSSDQEFTSMNAALRLSCEKKNPVRVIRGFKNHSPFAPDEGYRYDGLYRVEKCWREPGQSGFQVCKFAFVRLPDQPRIPVKEGREAEAEQMYKDMGFNLEALPLLAEKRQPWTQALAKQRRQAARQAIDELENASTREVEHEDPAGLSGPPRDEEQNHPGEDGDAEMQDCDKVDPVDVSEGHDKEHVGAENQAPNSASEKNDADGLAAVSGERGHEKKEENHDGGLVGDASDCVDVSQQPEMGPDDIGAEPPAVDEGLEAAASNQTHVSPQQQEAYSVQADVSKPQERNGEASPQGDAKVDVEDPAEIAKQQPDDAQEEAAAGGLKAGEDKKQGEDEERGQDGEPREKEKQAPDEEQSDNEEQGEDDRVVAGSLKRCQDDDGVAGELKPSDITKAEEGLSPLPAHHTEGAADSQAPPCPQSTDGSVLETCTNLGVQSNDSQPCQDTST